MDGEKKKYQALILVGGLGTRMAPHTEQFPKPMIDVEGRPFLEFKIESLKKYGIKDFILLVGHLGEKVEEYFGDGSRLGVNIKYSYEKDQLLGTAGAVKNAEHLIEGDFILVNGDVFLDIDIDKLMSSHEKEQMPFTISLSPATHPKNQELVKIEGNRVLQICKRNTPEHENHLITETNPLVNSGCYIISKSLLNIIPPNQKVSLELDIFSQIADKMNAYYHPGYMLDIANESDWDEFVKDFRGGLISPGISGYRKVIRSRAPVRITFGGGGTDLSPYDKEHGGVCINATINKYVYSSLKLRDDRKITIKSDIINLHGGFESYSENFDSIDQIGVSPESKLNIIRATILEMNPPFGFDLYVRSEIPPHSGLGASASLCVSVIGVLNHLRKKNRLTKHDIAETAFRVEQNRLNNIGGRQDQYAASFGGINIFEFYGDSNVRTNQIEMQKDYLLEIEKNILLVYSGMKGKSSGEIHKEEKEKNLYQDIEKVKRLHHIKQTGFDVAFNLRRGNLKKFGKLIKESWDRKKLFNPAISSMYIDAIIEEALNNGAIGARLMGAGGGGHVLIYCKPDQEHKVREVLNARGASAVDFSFDFEGLKVWEVEG